MNTEQAIQQLASDLAKQINANKSEDGYTIICTRRELRQIVEDTFEGIGGPERMYVFGHRRLRERKIDALMNDLFDELYLSHDIFLTLSQYDDVVLDERSEEL